MIERYLGRFFRGVRKGVVIFLLMSFLLVLRGIKPFILIRFGYFYSDRIGHFAFDLEYLFMPKETKQRGFSNGRLFLFIRGSLQHRLGDTGSSENKDSRRI